MKRLVVLLHLLIALTVACSPPAPAPTPQPTAVPLMVDADLVFPRPNADDAPVFGPISLRFAAVEAAGGAMTPALPAETDRAVVGQAFSLNPPAPGKFDWQGDTLLFKPDWPGLAPGAAYTIGVASTRLGDASRQPAQLIAKSFRFSTAGRLGVVSVTPEPDASDIAVDATTYVQFNRPVAPLSALIGAAPNLLQFEPPIEGSGRWVNTSLYAFTPKTPWRGGASYQVTVPEQVSGQLGGALGEAYRWRFTTAPPALATVEPKPDAKFVNQQPEITLAFNQAVDHASVETRFSLTITDSRAIGPATTQPAAIAGSFTWLNDKTAAFRPSQPLPAGIVHTARLVAGLTAPGGGAPNPRETIWQFTTTPAPGVSRVEPPGLVDGKAVTTCTIQFTSPMSRSAVVEKLVLTPQPERMPFFAWRDDDTRLTLTSFPAETRFTLDLPADTLDRFGRPIGQPLSVAFTTPPQPSAPAQVWLVSPDAPGIYDANGKPQAVLRVINNDSVTLTLEALEPDLFIDIAAWSPLSVFGPSRANSELLARDGSGRSQVVRAWTVDTRGDPNVSHFSTADLVDGVGRKLAPGFYRLTAQPSGLNAWPQRLVFAVSGVNLTVKQSATSALIWAVDTATGEPIADLPLQIFRATGPRLSSANSARANAAIASGRTDAQGRLNVEWPRSGVPTDVNQPILVVGTRPGDVVVGASNWNSGIASSDFKNWLNWNPLAWTGYLYADRPIYRPGQTVHLKGILRADDDGRFTVPPDNTTVSWSVRDNRGQAIVEGTAPISEFGSVTADFTLDADAAIGGYSASLSVDGQFVGSTRFRVAEYRRPEFELKVTVPVSSVVSGAAIPLALQADYYFGRPVDQGAVAWQANADPWRFTWAAEPGFRFGDNEPNDDQPPPLGPRAEGTGQTATNGRLDLSVPTDLRRDQVSQQFTIEATLTDLNDQAVSARAAVIVHRADLYLGLKPDQFVVTAGREQSVALVALNAAGVPRANQATRAQVWRRVWLSVREREADGELAWKSKPQDILLSTIDLTTDQAGRGVARFTPAEPGEYRLVVEGQDAAGNLARTTVSLWAAGAGFTPWRLENHDRIDLQADRTEYQPGQIARVLIPTPVENMLALITIERGKVIESRVERLISNSASIDVPLGAAHAPNVYVGVALYRGGDHPVARFGYVELRVSVADKRLQVRLEPERTQYAPRDTATFTVRTLDANGQGAPAEVSLALVDAAVLALVGNGAEASDPVDAFWRRRGLGVITGSTYAVSIDHLNEKVVSGRKGGSGSGGGTDDGDVRRDFQDTAFWAPTVRTDAAGRATVTIPLPDNLTTWRLVGLAVTVDTRFGQGTSDIVTAKPFLVRPVMPRFLVSGDEAALGAVLTNNTDQPLALRAALTATGLAVRDDGVDRSVDVPARGQTRLNWTVAARQSAVQTSATPPPATLRFTAQQVGGMADAVELRLPIMFAGAPIQLTTAGEVADAQTEVVDIPGYADRERGSLVVDVAPSLAAAMRYSLSQVEEFPYECLEQSVSRFLPRLALDRAINQLGLGDPLNLKADLPNLVNRSIQRIYRYQHPDGGWGWWRDDASQPYLTAYTLFGLTEARAAGYPIDNRAVGQSVTFLRDWLNGDPGVFGLDTRAYVLFALGQAGQPDPNRLSALHDRRAELGLWAKAYLALALAKSQPNDPRVGGLLSELTDAATISASGAHWLEARKPSDVWSFRTGVATTATVLDALARLRPNHPLVANAVRWLMSARQSGHWASTHDTALTLLTLTDVLAASGDLRGDFRWALALNGQDITSRGAGATGATAGEVNAETRASSVRFRVPVNELPAGASRLDLSRDGDAGRLYYSLTASYYLPTTETPAESRGLTIGREYLPGGLGVATPPGDLTPIEVARVGDIVRVRVTIIAPTELHHVIVEDPLPAGFEPFDPTLKTTAVAPQRALDATRNQSGGPWWQRWPAWSRVERRDQRVTLFATYLPKGSHEYSYLARAAIAGVFQALPANAYQQYFPDVFGRTDSRAFRIEPAAP